MQDQDKSREGNTVNASFGQVHGQVRSLAKLVDLEIAYGQVFMQRANKNR